MKEERAKVRKPIKEETSPKKKPAQRASGGSKKGQSTSQSVATQLQQQVGNRAVQQLLTRRGQSALSQAMDSKQVSQEREQDDEEKSKNLTEVGEVKIERPEVEYYDVDGSNLQEVSREILQDGKWFECEYNYIHKVKDGIITQVDVIVNITLKLPQWTGPGWQLASDDDKRAWLQMLEVEQISPEVIREITRLPDQFLGLDWEQAPEKLKGEWRAMVQSIQQQEMGYTDIAWRRAMVLQKLLFRQPEKQAETIFDRFEKDMEREVEAYGRQKKFGQEHKVSLSANDMLQ